MKIRTLFVASVAALSLSLPAFAANLVTNGSFEEGDFTGWTQFGNQDFSGVSFDWIDDTDPVHGARQAYFGPGGSNGGIRQSINTTVGKTYHLSFFLRQLAGDGVAEFAASFGSGPLVTLGGLGPHGGNPYEKHSFAVDGAGSPLLLEFAFRDDEQYFLLDDVVVTEGSATAIPEPGAWALMILGFTTAGAMLRRSRRALA